MNEKSENLLSVTQAAAALGITRKRILDFIVENRLPAQKIGETYVIKESDLDLVRNLKTGRPLSDNPSNAALLKRERRKLGLKN